MRVIRVTPNNVSAIMSVLNITDDMLMTSATAKNCKLCSSGSCKDECDKYQLSGDSADVGYSRSGACVLFRLNRLNNGEHEAELYAPADLLERAYECEDI